MMISLRLSYVKCISYEESYVEEQPTRYKVRLRVYRTRVEYWQAGMTKYRKGPTKDRKRALHRTTEDWQS